VFTGKVLSIHIAAEKNAPVQSVNSVQVDADSGIVGDRYYDWHVAHPESTRAKRDVTLIEVEAIDAIRKESGIDLKPEEMRRNILVTGVPLNHLVGREFLVGQVRMIGSELCEPCAKIEKLTGQPVIQALLHRAGLRAKVLTSGPIEVGDELIPVSPSE